MPPELVFHPNPSLSAAAPVAEVEVDLAGDRRPRCAVRLPQQAGAGVWRGDCACGASFAVTVCGGAGDPRSLWVACCERHQQRPAPGAIGARPSDRGKRDPG